MLAQPGFDGLVGKQAQRPTRVAFGRIGAGQRGDFGALSAVNLDWAARARSIGKAAQASRVVVVTPGRNGWIGDLEGGGNLDERLAAVELKQRSGAFERASRECAVSEQIRQRRAIVVAQGDVLFVHVQSLPDISRNVDQLNFQSTNA